MTIRQKSQKERVQKDSPKVVKLREELLMIIESAMEKEKISQGEIARRIGAQRYNINKIMRRKFPVSIDFLVKMTESIGLDVELKVKKVKD